MTSCKSCLQRRLALILAIGFVATAPAFCGDAPESGAEGVPCIDLNDASYRMMGVLGAEGSKRLQRPIDGTNVDNTHHSMYGAYEMARIIAAGPANIPVVGDAIRESYRAFDPEKPDPESAVAIPPSGAYRNVKPAGD